MMTHYVFQSQHEPVPIGKIICLARTYQKHAKEMNATVPPDPLLFLKPESAVIFNNESIRIPKQSSCLHHEIELGVVIGKEGKNIPEDNAMDYVLGYLVALDITARDIQSVAKQNGWPWSIAKGFDTFSPISDVVDKKKVSNPLDLDLRLVINGIVKQQSNTKYLMFSIEHIIAFISEIMTLKKGDLILTGTPEGVGELVEGDCITAHLGNLCSLEVDVQKQ